MGIPAFFRWLIRKCPQALYYVTEEELPEYEKFSENPNGFDIDNLYIDMNGLIHPCSHPENAPQPTSEEEIMENIAAEVTRLFNIARPRKLLMLAIDGVAPRAKMNQQRVRRYRVARDRYLEEEVEKERKANEEMQGNKSSFLKDQNNPSQSDEKAESDKNDQAKPKWTFDSNTITPGTQFMDNVAQFLRAWTAWMISKHDHWKGVTVIISDSNVPGEGEHKIMDYIRHQRCQPNYDNNVAHAICGLDADLIMLGLSTHEPNFKILREEIVFQNARTCSNCGDRRHASADCPYPRTKTKNYQWLDLQIMRRFLEHEFREVLMQNKDLEFERLIDDWVFINYFIGNDFLPHLPTLSIREGSIEVLTNLYKETLTKKGYITHHGDLRIEALQFIFTLMGNCEDDILAKQLMRQNTDNRIHSHHLNTQPNNPLPQPSQKRLKPENLSEEPSALPKKIPCTVCGSAEHSADDCLMVPDPENVSRPANSSEPQSPNSSGSASPASGKIQVLSDEEIPIPIPKPRKKDDPVPKDYVRLGREGWRARYYRAKFQKEMDDEDFFKELKTHYIRGLKWVLRYYTRGCPDWGWYYPYYHAPFSKEVIGIADLDIGEFGPSEPLTPIEQLLAVLPPYSAAALPPKCRELMTQPDSELVQAGFYPELDKLVVEADETKPEWLWILMLPFLDIPILRNVFAKDVKPTLTESEAFRNRAGEVEAIASAQHTALVPHASLKEMKLIEGSWLFGFAKKLERVESFIEPFVLEQQVQTNFAILGKIPECKAFSVAYQLPELPESGYFHGLLPNAVLTHAGFQPHRSNFYGNRIENAAENHQINYQFGENRQEKSSRGMMRFVQENQGGDNQQQQRSSFSRSPHPPRRPCPSCNQLTSGPSFCHKCGKPLEFARSPQASGQGRFQHQSPALQHQNSQYQNRHTSPNRGPPQQHHQQQYQTHHQQQPNYQHHGQQQQRYQNQEQQYQNRGQQQQQYQKRGPPQNMMQFQASGPQQLQTPQPQQMQEELLSRISQLRQNFGGQNNTGQHGSLLQPPPSLGNIYQQSMMQFNPQQQQGHQQNPQFFYAAPPPPPPSMNQNPRQK